MRKTLYVGFAWTLEEYNHEGARSQQEGQVAELTDDESETVKSGRERCTYVATNNQAKLSKALLGTLLKCGLKHIIKS